MGFFSKLAEKLTKTRQTFTGGLKSIFSGKVDEEFFEELEEALILADIGVTTSMKIAENLRARAKSEHVKEREALWKLLEDEMVKIVANQEGGIALTEGKMNILMLTGVNGAGKTTTIGKLSARYLAEGKKVLLAAADTYRAAAAEQLQGWADRVGVPIIRQAEGADPAAVVFDAIAAAKARNCDVLIVDTAGRLQNKTNLMSELNKMDRVIQREAADAVVQCLLVIDGGTGQNAISQAREFGQVVKLTGLIVTKLDGTAKGGSLVGIVDETHLPIKLIGVGEKVEDLRDFEAEAYVKALFEE